MKKNASYKVLDIIVTMGIILTLLVLLATPLAITAYFKSAFSILNQNLIMAITICIYICAIPYIIALFNLKKLCKLIVNNNPFSIDAPKSLKTISICAFSETILFNGCLIFITYYFDMYLYILTIAPMVIVTFISIAIGFLSFVLSKLFEIAIEIKDENDKTI
ncbi:DUF2975 domain-containing protein [[Clostridium] dakarense]|uniref:DUF2975 domain-containing protein n=1 Tax=Faecalimicrobium dakarense TaxID=1301100 RepID=UPI0004B646C4|nr:DUF2975 domain-containing protein [[Clostridium] dakarense]